MTRVVPLTELSRVELRGVAQEVNALVHAKPVAALLEARHLMGVLKRHSGDVDDSIRSLRRAKAAHESGTLAAYTVFTQGGKAAGMATVMPNLELREQSRAFRPAIARRLNLSKQIPMDGPEVKVWTSENQPPANSYTYSPLRAAYRYLVQYGIAAQLYSDHQAASNKERPKKVAAWTIEPVVSSDMPGWIHQALRASDFVGTQRGFYDDDESHRHSLPLSQLYVAVKDMTENRTPNLTIPE